MCGGSHTAASFVAQQRLTTSPLSMPSHFQTLLSKVRFFIPCFIKRRECSSLKILELVLKTAEIVL